eukprot:CAMPEP_0178559644 /NCGR_PEP_ID=MMETSP0697-20121206/11070_1 /TAXON_ID=265572 /ORGANISM="Extubocellulus spinifer, Strain CCMP396" /LENGTH=221 /DNA_ID=CAMNT_0020192861 /DNA_START=414 /DNA_END=1077 /DNA_ORIENTATION=+
MSNNIQEKVAENKADDSTKQATVLDGRPSGDNPPTGARGARESTEIARVELEQRQQQGMGNGGGGQGGGTTAGTETGQQPVGPFLTVATEAVPMRLETAGSLVRVAANQGRDDHSHLVADLIALSSIGGRMVYVRRDRGRDPIVATAGSPDGPDLRRPDPLPCSTSQVFREESFVCFVLKKTGNVDLQEADDSTKQATVLDSRPSGGNPPTGARGARESTE